MCRPNSVERYCCEKLLLTYHFSLYCYIRSVFYSYYIFVFVNCRFSGMLYKNPHSSAKVQLTTGTECAETLRMLLLHCKLKRTFYFVTLIFAVTDCLKLHVP